MSRRIVGLGVFDKRHTCGALLTNPFHQNLYTALKNRGFLETRWQFIYEGQRGGLVLPYGADGGKNEVHVRFYNDRVFAEYEVGRAYLGHFLGPRLNANRFLYAVLADAGLSSSELGILKQLLSKKGQVASERKMGKWLFNQSGDPFSAKRASERGIRLLLIILFSEFIIGWRAALLCSLLLLTILCLQSNLGVATFAVLVPPAVLYFALPKRGKP